MCSDSAANAVSYREECLLTQVARSSGKNRCFARADVYHSLLRTVTCVPNLLVDKANDLCS